MTPINPLSSLSSVFLRCERQRETETDEQRNRQRNRQRDEQTETGRDRNRQRQTDRPRQSERGLALMETVSRVGWLYRGESISSSRAGVNEYVVDCCCEPTFLRNTARIRSWVIYSVCGRNTAAASATKAPC
jgi:hypothetical protein